jgi:hypothetical protein
VEPVGELDEDDPDVLRHRQQHLPDVLGLLLFVAVGRELRQLGDAVDHVGDLGPEPLLEVLQAELRVLRHVVEECGLDREGIDAQLGRDLGRGDRVGHVRLAGRTHLTLVGLDRQVERLADRREVGLRVMARDRVEQVLLQRAEVRLGGLSSRDGRGRPTRAARLRPRRASLRRRSSVVGRRRSRLGHARSIARRLGAQSGRPFVPGI